MCANETPRCGESARTNGNPHQRTGVAFLAGTLAALAPTASSAQNCRSACAVIAAKFLPVSNGGQWPRFAIIGGFRRFVGSVLGFDLTLLPPDTCGGKVRGRVRGSPAAGADDVFRSADPSLRCTVLYAR